MVATPATVVTGCGETTEDCSSLRRPRYEVNLAGSSTIGWARLSSDGKILIASSKSDDPDFRRSSIVGIDLERKKEIWRVSLSEDPLHAPDDALVLPSVVVLAVPESKGALTIVALDRTSGRELWRRSRKVVHALGADLHDDFIITDESTHVRLLDAKSGAAAASASLSEASDLGFSRIRLSRTAAYVVDRGITRIPLAAPQLKWYQPFTTCARRSRSEDAMTTAGTVAAVGAAAALTGLLAAGMKTAVGPPIGALGGSSSETTGYELGRTSDPIEIEGQVCVASLGIVSCFDQTSGAFHWSRKFPIGQFRKLVARPGILCLLGGGPFVRIEDGTAAQAESPYRALYCVRSSDGAPLPGFATPLTSNRPGVPLSTKELAGYNPETGDQALGDHGIPSGGKGAPRIADITATESGILVAQDGEVLLLTLPAGTTPIRNDLSDLGSVRHLTAAGDIIVANLGHGFAGFDATTGALLWKRLLRLGELPPTRSTEQDRPMVVPTASGQIGADYPLTMPRGGMRERYWLLPRLNTLVAAESGGRLAGISLDAGIITWRLPGADEAVVGGPDRSWLVTVRGAEIEVYTLPLLAAAAASDRGTREVTAIQTSYQAPEGCPSQDAFERVALGQSEQTHLATTTERTKTFRIQIAASGPDVKGSLEIVGVDGSVARREVTGTRCDEVTSAIALMVSMAVETPLATAAQHASPQPSQTELAQPLYDVIQAAP
jgi:hypothetical protein